MQKPHRYAMEDGFDSGEGNSGDACGTRTVRRLRGGAQYSDPTLGLNNIYPPLFTLIYLVPISILRIRVGSYKL